MTTHTWVNDDVLKVICTYCSTEIKEGSWQLALVSGILYRINGCSCGKETWVKDGKNGSTFDGWEGILNFAHDHFHKISNEIVIDGWNEKQFLITNRPSSIKIEESKNGTIKTLDEKVKILNVKPINMK